MIPKLQDNQHWKRGIECLCRYHKGDPKIMQAAATVELMWQPT